MAKKNKIGMQFAGFEELAKRLDEAAGTDGLKRAVEGGLKASKQYVDAQIKSAMQPPKLPAKGKYSTGATMQSMIGSYAVEWDGMTAAIDVGFDLEKTLTSIYLMYGTPRMKPDADLYNAIYGAAAKKKIKELQEQAVNKVLQRVTEG